MLSSNLNSTGTSKSKSALLKLTTVVILTAAVVISFYPALDNEFTNWDDQFYVTENVLIQNPTMESLSALGTKIISLNYHPLTMMSLWANSYISGSTDAGAYISTNITIHLLNTLLVYIIILKLFPREFITAFTTAIIFGIHPMHTESVVWVSERKDVLYTFFFLLGLLSYHRYQTLDSIRFLIFSFLLFLLSCLSKAMAVSFVPVLYLIDYLTGRSFKSIKLHLEKTPFIILALLIGLIALDVQSGGNFYDYLESSVVEQAIGKQEFTITDKIKHVCFGLHFYFEQFLFPTKLCAFHPFSYLLSKSLSPIWLIATLSYLGILLYSFMKSKRIFFCLSFFLVTIALVIQIIPVGSAVVAERYSYIPYIGLGLLLGSLLQNIWKTNYKYSSLLIIIAIIISCIVLTRKQSDVWQNHITLFANVVDNYTEQPQGRQYLASGYWVTGQLDSAIHHLEYAINELHFVNSTAFQSLANCYADKNEPNKAIAFYNESLRLDKSNVVARYHRALLLMDTDPAISIKELTICENADNEYIKNLIYTPRGRCYGFLKQFDQALIDQNKAINLYPDEVNNYLDRAVTYENLNKWELAKEDYRTALSINPSEAFAKSRLASIK